MALQNSDYFLVNRSGTGYRQSWDNVQGDIDLSQVNYTYPSGVQQTVQDRLEQHVSVKDFGAVGDGTTDDTTAFTDAAGSTAVDSIFIPAGSYALTTAITGNFYATGPVTFVGVGSVSSFKVLGETLVLTSPNGTQYALSVADDGTLSTTAV